MVRPLVVADCDRVSKCCKVVDVKLVLDGIKSMTHILDTRYDEVR